MIKTKHNQLINFIILLFILWVWYVCSFGPSRFFTLFQKQVLFYPQNVTFVTHQEITSPKDLKWFKKSAWSAAFSDVIVNSDSSQFLIYFDCVNTTWISFKKAFSLIGARNLDKIYTHEFSKLRFWLKQYFLNSIYIKKTQQNKGFRFFLLINNFAFNFQICTWLGLQNSAVNFIIYGVMNQGYREGYKKLFNYILCRT